jgi:hypothetical protein
MQLTQRQKTVLRVVIPLVIVLGVLGYGALPEGPFIVTPPPEDAEPGRWVHIEGAANTRDAGAYPTTDGKMVKPDTIYRSATLSRISWKGAETFEKLGVNSVIDFRNRLSPLPLFNGDRIGIHMAARVYGCPVSFSKDVPPDHFYIQGVADNKDSYREAFELLSEPDNLPAMYHCAAGTDRTGVMSALLLKMLGVDRETIMEDFLLSNKVDKPGHHDDMVALLDHVEEQGGIEKYLEGIGVTRDLQQRIRDLMLTDAEAPVAETQAAP